MTHAQAIAMLDRQIARHGQTVTLRRGTKDSPVATLALSAFVRAKTGTDLVAGKPQQVFTVALSPTGLDVFPKGQPEQGDFIEINGKFRAIEQPPRPIYMDGVLVRVNLEAKG